MRPVTLLVVLVTMLAACKASSPDEDAYIEDPYPDEVGPDAPVCQWRTPPDGPEGTSPYPVAERLPLSDSESCADIPAADVDAALLEKAESILLCERPVDALLRGCYSFAETSEGRFCDFGAYFFTTCEVQYGE